MAGDAAVLCDASQLDGGCDRGVPRGVNPPRRRPAVSPRLTILPKTLGPGEVGQFQRRLRNWYWHSSMASWAPRRTESITSRFLLHICTWRWIKPFSFSQVSSSEMLPTEDSFARYLP